MQRGEQRGVDLVAHGVGQREVQHVPLQREVERVAADVAGRLQPARERELPGLARVGARQQAVLDLGGERQRHRALAPLEEVGEPAVGDDRRRPGRARRTRPRPAPVRRAARRGGARARRSPPRGWSPARTRASRPRRVRRRPICVASARPGELPISGTRSAVSSPCVARGRALPAWPSRISAWPLKSAMRKRHLASVELVRAVAHRAHRRLENGGASSTAATGSPGRGDRVFTQGSEGRPPSRAGSSCITAGAYDPALTDARRSAPGAPARPRRTHGPAPAWGRARQGAPVFAPSCIAGTDSLAVFAE